MKDLSSEYALLAIQGPKAIMAVQGLSSLDLAEIKYYHFKIGDFAYIPDVSKIYEQAWKKITGIGTLVIDALRYDPHPSHSHLAQTLEWIKALKPKKAYLTNLNIELDYKKLSEQVPENVSVCYDMLKITNEL